MKKKNWIVLILLLAIVCVIVIGGVSNRDTVRMQICDECEGAGTVTVADYSTGEETEFVCATCEGTGEVPSSSSVYGTFWALVPPIVAIALALITKEVYSSLFIGIVLGGLMYSNYNFSGTVDAVVNNGLISAVADGAGIFIFLVILGIIVSLVNKAGGSQAFGRWAATHIKSKAGACIATFLLGVLIFIDDYFNCLTVGSVMRPLTDSKQGLPGQAGVFDRRHGGAGLHDRADLLLGRRCLRLRGQRPVYRPAAVCQGHPLQLLFPADAGLRRGHQPHGL